MQKKMLKLPLIIAISVFSLSMVLLWVAHAGEINRSILLMGASYALLCFVFLIFQIGAFVRAHVVYDEDVEGIKMKVFEVENDEYQKKF